MELYEHNATVAKSWQQSYKGNAKLEVYHSLG